MVHKEHTTKQRPVKNTIKKEMMKRTKKSITKLEHQKNPPRAGTRQHQHQHNNRTDEEWTDDEDRNSRQQIKGFSII